MVLAGAGSKSGSSCFCESFARYYSVSESAALAKGIYNENFGHFYCMPVKSQKFANFGLKVPFDTSMDLL